MWNISAALHTSRRHVNNPGSFLPLSRGIETPTATAWRGIKSDTRNQERHEESRATRGIKSDTRNQEQHEESRATRGIKSDTRNQERHEDTFVTDL
ncbi:hypothetical protein VZT92_021843 [Zoarces viviparus]|uniref:Uncharacterized protein n=1 Tax=Zoarces viviparus TaxID=48416 RepID=A0AAW1E943_ZOAVI